MKDQETQGTTETAPRSCAPVSGSAANAASEIDVVAVIKLPLPMNGFIGLMRGIQKDFDGELYIRNCPEGYEVYRKQQNAKLRDAGESGVEQH